MPTPIHERPGRLSDTHKFNASVEGGGVRPAIPVFRVLIDACTMPTEQLARESDERIAMSVSFRFEGRGLERGETVARCLSVFLQRLELTCNIGRPRR